MLLREPLAKILVVDDEAKNVKLMEAQLAPRGYAIITAYSGEEAISQVEQEQPDLILLDILMPGMSGFEVCKRLKDDHNTRLIPIVIMTALGQVEDRIRGIEAGADDFLTKPVNHDELLARIRTALRMKQTIERKIAGLVAINQRLAKTVDPDDVIRVLLESTNQLFATEGASAAFIDETRKHLTFTTSVGGARLEQRQIKLGQGIMGWVAQTGRGVVCSDVSHDPRFSDGIDQTTGFRTKSVLCAPILQGEQIIGTLEAVNTANTEGFSQEDLQLLTALCGLAVAAIDRTKILSALQNTRTAFQEVVQDRYHLVGGESPAMQETLRLAQTVAAANTTVLLLGESGTGKEVVARAIHQWSPRADQAFVAVNCTALTPELLESELFGHEKGAFTGASAQKKGKFELAERGTIFLDEIGDLALNLQVKLLRVLQEREFQRVGGTRDIPLDVRILAATNQDLRRAVQNGAFREDLYFRLNVISLTLPPLRERPEDIAVLVDYFIERYSHEVKRSRMHIDQDALQALQAYTWPGNIRELQNAIERAVVLSPGEGITLADLPTEVRYSHPLSPVLGNGGGQQFTIDEIRPMAEAMDAYQRALVRKALEVANDSQTKASKLLGVPQPSLSRMMRRLGLR